MLLDGEDQSRLLGRLFEQGTVDRLQGMQIDDPGVDSIAPQQLGGGERLRHHAARGDEG